MKYLVRIALLLAIAAALCGCRQASPAPGAISPTAATRRPATGTVSSYPPEKTASQDTAGAVTGLPEAATAAATVDGTLAP